MKKFVLFSVSSILLFCIFTASLYFEGGKAISLWLKAHSVYVITLVILIYIYGFVFWYRRYKKCKTDSVQMKVAAALRLRANAGRSKKFNRWMTASLIIFCSLVSMLLFLNLSEKNFILWVAGLTIIYMTGTMLLNINHRRNNKLQLERAVQAKETLNLKLRSIRSQLNPHFMFNALTSIQNLMNKNDIPAANHYLAMFADLTRKVLNTSDQELISLEDELQILEDYLQMEQLRFGFKYKIKVDESINKANTEIPAMLLQPFVENAVKHGVAAIQQNGTVEIQIAKQGTDLILFVTDNGHGFDKSLIQSATSLGLKLSEERIALLNEVNPHQPVTLHIYSAQIGTAITITLVNLFL